MASATTRGYMRRERGTQGIFLGRLRKGTWPHPPARSIARSQASLARTPGLGFLEWAVHAPPHVHLRPKEIDDGAGRRVKQFVSAFPCLVSICPHHLVLRRAIVHTLSTKLVHVLTWIITIHVVVTFIAGLLAKVVKL